MSIRAGEVDNIIRLPSRKKQYPPRKDAPRRKNCTRDGAAGGTLPAARFTEQAERPPVIKRQVHPIHSFNHLNTRAFLSEEINSQVLDVQHRD